MAIRRSVSTGLVAIATFLSCQISFAQNYTSTSTSRVSIVKGSSLSSMKRRLEDDLRLRVVKNVLQADLGVRMTSEVEAKLPDLVELLIDSIEITFDPPDGEVMSGRAKITVAASKIQSVLRNKGIGAGDIAAQSAKILVSLDEYIGVATNLDAKSATSVEVNYSHDKSRFSDTSAKSSGNASQAASFSESQKNDLSMSGRQSSAESSRYSSSVAARQDTAVAGRSSAAAAAQGGGSAAGASSSGQYAGSQSTQIAGARSAQSASSNSTQIALADRSQSNSSGSASSSVAFSSDQRNVQQQNDTVSYSVKTKAPDFGNAKPVGGAGLITARLSAEFKKNGLELVLEEDLRAEGGRTLPIAEIQANGRIRDFQEKIERKQLEADVWARGSANYSIVGTRGGVTECNGQMFVEAQFLKGSKQVFFTDSLSAAARGNGDQECRAALGLALATSLAQTLGQQAVSALQARNARGEVYTLYVYTLNGNGLGRKERNDLTKALSSVKGISTSQTETMQNYMKLSIQIAGAVDNTLNQILDSVGWQNADFVNRGQNKICIGFEGKHACPVELR